VAHTSAAPGAQSAFRRMQETTMAASPRTTWTALRGVDIVLGPEGTGGRAAAVLSVERPCNYGCAGKEVRTRQGDDLQHGHTVAATQAGRIERDTGSL